jgi:hypothetical protein
MFFFRDRPPTPPSASSGRKDNPFLPSIKLLITNKVVWMLVVIFGFIQAVFNTLGTVVGEMADKFGYSTVILLDINVFRNNLRLLGQFSLLED